MKILVIEDDVMLADSIRAMLEKRGFRVECVHDGESGADHALTGIYDLLILDVMMPKLDGLQVARQVRAQRCATPILMLSAREFDMMRFLLRTGHRNISKATLLSRVWGLESNAVENHEEVYVAMLQPSIIYKRFKKSLWPYFSF